MRQTVSTPPSLDQPHHYTARTITTTIAMAAIAATVTTVDQLSKTLALTRLMTGPADAPGPFWFRLVANRGALMGFPLPTWLLLIAAFAVLAMAISTVTRAAPKRIILGWGLIVGGAGGNIADRFQHRPRFPDHAVVDWIASTSLPTFNLADVAIITGLALVTLATVASPSHQPNRQQELRT